MNARSGGALALLAALAAVPAPAADDATDRALAAITRVTREGKGNEDAAPAWKALVARGGPALLPALAAFDDANPTAANWLRTAVDAIADAERAAGKPLPADQLEAFATNPKFAAASRRQAYELLVTQIPAARDRLLPTFLNDKSPDLRRDAVAYELDRLERDGKTAPRAELEKLFAATRDKDQVELLAKKVKEAGGTASTTAHLGFVTAVQIVGPFDGPESKGFGVAYPPEAATAATGALTGKDDAKLKWVPASTTDRNAVFDLNKFVGKHKNAVAYSLATVVAEKETPCEVRVTSPTSVKIFLNQKELFGRDEYHHGAPFDGHTGRGTLRKGENVIVVKVCQNNQTESWAQKWEFQVRVCDATGGPLAGVTQLAADGKPLPLGILTEAPAEEKK